MSTAEKTEPVLELTDEAANWIGIFMKEQKLDPESFAFRLGVMGGGCSGMQYLMRMDKPKEADLVFEHNGSRMVIDEKSAKLLNGSKLHFVMQYQNAGFTVVNPRMQSACGCGASFTIGPPTQKSPPSK